MIGTATKYSSSASLYQLVSLALGKAASLHLAEQAASVRSRARWNPCRSTTNQTM
jgi:hypothetical protein